ncbi:uncharacterized protein LOC132287009 [Cornus florida]|uniref:uncharacterized protein LOC132287009 n=1 Tax=Cornus florida TaxID=4283 RepID=UPI00289BD1D3|nr:uncharacterized protein LOC132287009 [Cornus florida]
MGVSESGIGCKKHTNDQQLPGVCSSCLRERLSDLSYSSSSHANIYTANMASSYTSLSYSSASSVCISPTHGHGRRHRRTASDVKGSISFILNANTGLKKSRSMAFVARSRGLDGSVSGRKKGGRFWSKLIRSTGNKMKGVLMHSRTTVKERFEY